MKKLLKIAMTLLFGLTLATSCGVNEDTSDVYTSMATVIESNYSSSPYYIVFDDGKSARVTNTSDWSPTFPEKVSELRYIISYEIINQSAVGFDMEIKIVEVSPIVTGSVENVSAADFTGEKGLQNYTSCVGVEALMITTYHNYITLLVNYLGSNAYNIPNIRLVCNQPDSSPYKDLYVENDGYLYLELYYDNYLNEGLNELATFRSFKVGNAQSIINSYKGIKVLSISPKTERPEVFTHNFFSEGN